MAGFLSAYLSRLRFWYAAKQVCAEIQQLSSAQGAHLALTIALLRAKMSEVQAPGSSFAMSEVIQHPMAYREEICDAAFRLLKDMRQAEREKIRSYESFGVSPSPVLREHTELSDLGFSLLMSTLAVGCNPGILKTVKFSWETIATFSPLAANIEVLMTMPEYILNDEIVQPIETDRWLEMARTLPDFLKTSL